MKKINISFFLFIITALFLSSCVKDLDVEPIDPNVSTANNVFDSPEAYKQALAKIYASYAVSGQTGGGGGNGDIRGIDENFGNYLRQLWGLQELPTDEAIIAWDDATIKNFHWHTWASNDVFIAALYSRIFYSISVANEFIRNTANETGDIAVMNADARFLRAFSYYHAIDMFGNVPFVTEADKPGAFSPTQISRADLFKYIEEELIDLDSKLGAPRFEYGRADQAAGWMLLAKLYMNAEVYTGTAKYAEAITQLNKVIAAGYSIDPTYQNVFRADNNNSPEMIFPICFDGTNTQQYGGMTFILHASNGGGMPLNGIDGGWGGIRAIKDFAENHFGVLESDFSSSEPEYTTIADKRGMFYFNPDEWVWDIANVGTFTQGVGVTKFKNISADGSPAPNAHPTFASTDFPVFRLADAYLMYAEAFVRGGGGDEATALGYINSLRQRAYGDNSGDITAGELTLDFLLSERARELYWEAQRRTDLIRFGKFTGGDYVWEWKGNVQAGTSTESHMDLYPIPSNDLNANPNLKQNTGYTN
ncbi:MAG: RagB/SusD family nutrient uptake outer membrane protein [Bacteroidetes bacterium 4572_117]|nr:MAG: RagB/SusD family nutrient uptake outer membrane protein [Bacteroidetes bacterium 4572_117]